MSHVAPKQKILIVDDTPENIQVLMEVLKDDCTIIAAINGERALKLAAAHPAPDIILLDVMMPGMSGYEVCARLKEIPDTRDIPVIFVTAMGEADDEAKGLDLGAVDYIVKPFIPKLVRARVRNQLELKNHRDNLEKLVQQRTRELVLTQEVTIESMANLVEARDPETGGHIKRTQSYVRILAEKLKHHAAYAGVLSDATIDMLYKSSPLHDIGKVGVPDHILNKPGKLTESEFQAMKAHTTLGYQAMLAAEKRLGENSFLQHAREVAHSHHEKWDGTGYPLGLKTTQIPVSGRIMAIADVYDALTCKRVYKPPFPHAKAVAIIAEGKGAHFDPVMVEAFLEVENEFRRIALEFADSEEERETLTGQQQAGPAS